MHVENVAQEFIAVEVEETGAEGQEEQFQEFEVAGPAEEQAFEANFANSDSQPGKHRKHLIQSLLYKSKFHAIYLIYLCIMFIGVVWYLDA